MVFVSAVGEFYGCPEADTDLTSIPLIVIWLQVKSIPGFNDLVSEFE
jgi:hypothetical protein